MTRVIALFSAATVAIVLTVGVFVALRATGGDQFSECRRGTVAGGVASIGGPFELVDGTGRVVTDADVISRPTLVYFGYSFCPDFCPNDLARNALAADMLAERGIDVGQVFISIDPERDTPEVASEFASYIHPALIGLSGSPEQVAAAASAYRVYFARAGDDPDFYLMDHSTFTYLVAPGHGFLEFYATTLDAEEVAESTACFVGQL
jgi:protein SCO1